MLCQNFSETRLLTDLGLTLTQAKIYLSLNFFGPSTISNISKNSHVARPDIYRNLRLLEKFSLVERIIACPIEYKAIPIVEGASLLFEKKTIEYKELKAQTQMLINSKQEIYPNRKLRKDYQVILIPKGKAVIERLNLAIALTEFKVNCIISWKRFTQGFINKFCENIENACKRNIKIQIITNAPEHSKTSRDLIELFNEKPFCELKFIKKYPDEILGIYDEKEAFIMLNPKTDLMGSPALWSNNSSIVSLAQNRFDQLWLSAFENYH